jgi:hypothetical protein
VFFVHFTVAGVAGIMLRRGRADLHRAPAGAALAGFASTVWIQQVAPDAPSYPQRNIPNGRIELRCAAGALPEVVGPLTAPLVEVLAPAQRWWASGEDGRSVQAARRGAPVPCGA